MYNTILHNMFATLLDTDTYIWYNSSLDAKLLVQV